MFGSDGHIVLAHSVVRLQVIEQILARCIFDLALRAFRIAEIRETATIIGRLMLIILVEKCLSLVLSVVLHVFLDVFGQITLTDLALRRKVNGIGVLWIEFAEDRLLLQHDLAL